VRSSEIPRDIALRIKLVILDVDGVLTDNGVYVGESEDGKYVELKRFDILDGLGIKMIRTGGMQIAFVSGRNSPASARRARELDVECRQAGEGYKMDAVKELMQQHGVVWEEIAWVGDDLPDLPAMTRVGLPVAVANAVAEVKATAVWTTRARGGAGAVREFAEKLLKARGQWTSLVAEYVAKRS
jgi:3-deoxy-D-manno-octulosonate 8-phosphate phosphatase (KDO 8-P phosphatase)